MATGTWSLRYALVRGERESARARERVRVPTQKPPTRPPPTWRPFFCQPSLQQKLFATRPFLSLQARLACVAADARAATAAGGAWLPALATAAARSVTTPLFLAGAAMAPTLNAAARTNPAAVEGLLLWREPGLAPRVGDVVALHAPPRSDDSPSSASPSSSTTTPFLEAQGAVLVRRVGAVAGDALITDDPDAGEFAVPPGHVWVTADNAALPPVRARDSRAFGPVPTASLLGRVVYAAASVNDHGPVTDGVPRATVADAAAVLAAEPVDVGSLVRW